VCGPLEAHLRQVEKHLDVQLAQRGGIFRIQGEPLARIRTERVLRALLASAATSNLDAAQVHLALSEYPAATSNSDVTPQEITLRTKRGTVKARGANQQKYLHAIHRHDISFGVGPAGTGKTWLAVASAVAALEENRVQRIVLARPAVEAGEKLGFLPGDLSQKVDPYLRPLYDALYEMLGNEKVTRLIERNSIEIAPLAYMRGRTLNDAFVILDEAQNTTIEQMKMFLTRIGFGAKAVITGDITQIDLPKHISSGLKHAIQVLRDVEGVSFTFFESRDVVRHPLVQKIVNAYAAFESPTADGA
jgi:phosphate starvation-inducible protein PhoH and related proteins